MLGPHGVKHKSLDFIIKQEVIKCKENGQGKSAIGCALGLSEFTENSRSELCLGHDDTSWVWLLLRML